MYASNINQVCCYTEEGVRALGEDRHYRENLELDECFSWSRSLASSWNDRFVQKQKEPWLSQSVPSCLRWCVNFCVKSMHEYLPIHLLLYYFRSKLFFNANYSKFWTAIQHVMLMCHSASSFLPGELEIGGLTSQTVSQSTLSILHLALLPDCRTVVTFPHFSERKGTFGLNSESAFLDWPPKV